MIPCSCLLMKKKLVLVSETINEDLVKFFQRNETIEMLVNLQKACAFLSLPMRQWLNLPKTEYCKVFWDILKLSLTKIWTGQPIKRMSLQTADKLFYFHVVILNFYSKWIETRHPATPGFFAPSFIVNDAFWKEESVFLSKFAVCSS